ncbi:hypothetical protein HBB16_00265 [Pseudonocardia sp. MCCB 268]|nr:hypothetical protein [Pseudonocardia cytotoxica]
MANDDSPCRSTPGPAHRPTGRGRLRTPLVDRARRPPWDRGRKRRSAPEPEPSPAAAGDEYLPFAGQTVGFVHDVRPKPPRSSTR